MFLFFKKKMFLCYLCLSFTTFKKNSKKLAIPSHFYFTSKVIVNNRFMLPVSCFIDFLKNACIWKYQFTSKSIQNFISNTLNTECLKRVIKKYLKKKMTLTIVSMAIAPLNIEILQFLGNVKPVCNWRKEKHFGDIDLKILTT